MQAQVNANLSRLVVMTSNSLVDLELTRLAGHLKT